MNDNDNKNDTNNIKLLTEDQQIKLVEIQQHLFEHSKQKLYVCIHEVAYIVVVLTTDGFMVKYYSSGMTSHNVTDMQIRYLYLQVLSHRRKRQQQNDKEK